MALSERLKAVYNMVDYDSVPADIGCDHGYLPVELVKTGKCSIVYASDISKESLKKTEKLVSGLGYGDKILTRVGDGLSVYKAGEINEIILSGMGGHIIINILKSNMELVDSSKAVIMQPLRDIPILRKWIYDNGYKIINEDIVFENNHFYEIIKAVRGVQIIKNDIFYEIGINLINKKHPLLKKYIEYKLDLLNNILCLLNDQNRKSVVLRKKTIKENIKKLKEVYYGL